MSQERIEPSFAKAVHSDGKLPPSEPRLWGIADLRTIWTPFTCLMMHMSTAKLQTKGRSPEAVVEIVSELLLTEAQVDGFEKMETEA